MRMKVAGIPGHARDIDGVVPVQIAPLGYHIEKSPQRVVPGQHQPAASIARNPHGAPEAAPGHAQRIGRIGVDQEQLADLIGGNRERRSGGMEPRREALLCLDLVGRSAVTAGADMDACDHRATLPATTFTER